MQTFNEIFDELAKTNDRSIIWNNWMDYCIEINLINHNGKKTNFYGNQEKYVKLMQAWMTELTKELENKPYYDILGHFYEELVQSAGKSKSLGQAFTPPSVTDLMSHLAIKNNDNMKGIANDPTCGSSRTLLAAHVESNGDLICIGQDLDRTSCQMSVLNFWSHGVRGSVLHMDTLEGTFYQGWRVNKYLYHGLPVPHIEEIYSIDAAYDFFELNNKEPSVPADVVMNPNDIEKFEINCSPDKGISKKITYKDGQTTLM